MKNKGKRTFGKVRINCDNLKTHTFALAILHAIFTMPCSSSSEGNGTTSSTEASSGGTADCHGLL